MSEIIKALSTLNPVALSIILIIAAILLIILCIFIYIIVIKQGRTIEILGVKIGSGGGNAKPAKQAKPKEQDDNVAPYTYDAFISIPITGLKSDNEYQTRHEELVKLIEVLKSHCGMKDVFYLGTKTGPKSKSGLPDVVLKEVFQAIQGSRYYIGIYPEKVATGAYVETGYAFALNKDCVIFTTNIGELPGIIRKAPGMLSRVKVYEYADIDDLLSKVREYGIKIFNAQANE